ncbi:MAG: hypothetical protein JO206_09905, partial [Solirubrobacterales bacterium]|nr:hypothetical protein [Solirubrobacterales bacterium]
MRSRVLLGLLGTCAALAGCGGGGGTPLLGGQGSAGGGAAGQPSGGSVGVQLGIPTIATKNTTRVAGADPAADAAGVALAVFPSAAPGTHPGAVTIAPSDDWQAAIAAAVLMSPPIHAPVLLSGSSALPASTAG